MTAAGKVSAGLQPYPAYKDSGVAWIGEIPVGWEVRRLKEIAKLRAGSAFPDAFQGNPAGEIAFLKVRNLENDGKRTITNSNHWISIKTAQILNAYIFDAGVFVIAKIGAALLKNRVRQLGMRCCIDNNMMAITVSAESSDFMAYALQTLNFAKLAESAAVPSLSAGKVGQLPVVIPSPTEQHAIATFLDRETARVDELLREQGLLLEELGLKRQATITHAVIESQLPGGQVSVDLPWARNMPASWQLLRLKNVLLGFEQGWSPEGEAREATEDEWGVLKSGCVNRGVFRADEHKALRGDIVPRPELEVQEGDLLMSRASGSLALIGSVAMVGAIRKQLMLSDKLFRLIPKADQVNTRFLYYAMNSAYMRLQIRQVVSGAEGLANNIGKGNIGNFMLMLPPPAEQQAIVDHLDAQLAQIDELTEEVRASMDLMRQHRAALITAAVTGKIDVRNLA